MQVELVPVARLVGRLVRRHRVRRMQQVVAVAGHQPGAALRPGRRDHAGGPSAPVVSGQHRGLDPQRVHQRPQVGTEHRLLAGPQGVRIEETRRAVAAQEGHQHPAAPLDQAIGHRLVGMDVIRKAVQQHDRRPVARTLVPQADAQVAGVDLTDLPHRLSPAVRDCLVASRGFPARACSRRALRAASAASTRPLLPLPAGRVRSPPRSRRWPCRPRPPGPRRPPPGPARRPTARWR